MLAASVLQPLHDRLELGRRDVTAERELFESGVAQEVSNEDREVRNMNASVPLITQNRPVMIRSKPATRGG